MSKLHFISICVKIGIAVKFAESLNIVDGNALQSEARLLDLISNNRGYTTVIDNLREYF